MKLSDKQGVKPWEDAQVARAIWTDEHDRQLLELHGRGATQTAASAAMGVSRQTLAKHSRTLGLTWEGAIVKKGAVVKQAVVAEKRASLADEILSFAEERMAWLKSGEYRDLVKGEYGAEGLADLDIIPSRSLQSEAAALKSLADTVERLKRLDDLNSGGSAVDAYLGYVTAGEIRLRIIEESRQRQIVQGEIIENDSQTGD